MCRRWKKYAGPWWDRTLRLIFSMHVRTAMRNHCARAALSWPYENPAYKPWCRQPDRLKDAKSQLSFVPSPSHLVLYAPMPSIPSFTPIPLISKCDLLID